MYREEYVPSSLHWVRLQLGTTRNESHNVVYSAYTQKQIWVLNIPYVHHQYITTDSISHTISPSLCLWVYSGTSGGMAEYTLLHFTQLSLVQLSNQLWDFLVRATGSLGLIPHEDSGIPRRELLSCSSHNEGQIGRTLAHALQNHPPVSAVQSLL